MPNLNCDEIIVGNEFPKKVTPLIKSAHRSIDIIVFDWRWYPDQVGSNIQIFNNAIVDRSRHGVQCRAITNFNSNFDLLKSLGIKVKKYSSRKTLHSKLIIIDGKFAIIGSHNYTMGAFNINHELSIMIDQPAFISRLEQYFTNLWRL